MVAGMMFPKQKPKKKQKKHPDSILQGKDAGYCYLCGQYCFGLEEHHIFGGWSNRKLSEEYGLKVKLCYMDHRDSKEGVHHNKEKANKLKAAGQRAFIELHGEELFQELFKKNYL